MQKVLNSCSLCVSIDESAICNIHRWSKRKMNIISIITGEAHWARILTHGPGSGPWTAISSFQINQPTIFLPAIKFRNCNFVNKLYSLQIQIHVLLPSTFSHKKGICLGTLVNNNCTTIAVRIEEKVNWRYDMIWKKNNMLINICLSVWHKGL